MMRQARNPRQTSSILRTCAGPKGTERGGSARPDFTAGIAAFALAALLLMPGEALAQSAEFPKTPGGIFGASPSRPDKAQPLHLQGDELSFDSKNNRVTAKGNVEIHYNGYLLTAQEVIYDQGARTLTAKGDVRIKDPNGNLTRGELVTLTDDFRDAFAQSLSVITSD